MLSQSLSSYMRPSYCAWNTLFSWSHLPSLTLTDFLLPLLSRVLRPEGRNLMNFYVLEMYSGYREVRVSCL